MLFFDSIDALVNFLDEVVVIHLIETVGISSVHVDRLPSCAKGPIQNLTFSH